MPMVAAVLGPNARLGNFRLGYRSPLQQAARRVRVRIALDGVERRDAVRRSSGFAIRDAVNDEPKSCSLLIEPGAAPEVGQALRITIDSDNPRHLFNGAIQSLETSYEGGHPAMVVYPTSAVDDLAALDKMIPFGVWIDTSATTVATDLIATFAPGFTSTHVEAGLPTISIALDGSEGFSGALRQIASLIGGYFYVEDSDLHLFITEATDTPDPLTNGSFLNEPPITKSVDDSQLKTRVYGKGHGESVLTDVAASETIIPIENAAGWFNPSGGRAIVDTQRLTYTGIETGGAGAVVGTSAAPTAAPGATVSGGGSVDTGVHDYAFVFGTAVGKSLPSPLRRVTTNTVVMAPPTSAPTMSINPLNQASGLTPGTSYKWLITYESDDTHETTIGPESTALVAVANRQVYIEIPTPPTGPTTRVNIYRKISGTYYHELAGVVETASNLAPGAGATIGFTSDASLVLANVQPPAVNTASLATVNLTGISTGPTGTTYREVYRTAAGGSQLKLVATIANNTATTYTDSAADSSLGANAPTGDTSGLTTATGFVNAGSTSLLLTGTGAFNASGGWTENGIRYSGISGNNLTGIPSSGIGAIVTTLPYGTPIIAAPALRGVLGLTRALVKGATVNIWVQRDDVDAQVEAAARETTEARTSTGIHEFLVSDERRSEASLIAVCDAHLALFARPIVTVVYATRDIKSKSGKTIVINLTSPPIDETLTIQEVAISELDIVDGLAPKFTVVASSIRFSLEATIRRLSGLLPG